MPRVHGDWLERRVLGGTPRVILVAPHHDEGCALLAARPDVILACAADESTLRRYLAVDADVGSRQLAVCVADHIAAAGVGVELLLPRLPRGIIDAGRLPSRALRHVFRLGADPGLLGWLVHTHAVVVGEVITAIRALDRAHGLFVDLHTMSPRSPAIPRSLTEAVYESPGRLREYIAAFEDGEHNRVAIDLITRIGSDVVGDRNLIDSLVAAFEQADLRWVQDVPYAASDHIVAGALMQERRGIMIDIPKDLLTLPPFDLAAVIPAPDRVEVIAVRIAAGILGALS